MIGPVPTGPQKLQGVVMADRHAFAGAFAMDYGLELPCFSSSGRPADRPAGSILSPRSGIELLDAARKERSGHWNIYLGPDMNNEHVPKEISDRA